MWHPRTKTFLFLAALGCVVLSLISPSQADLRTPDLALSERTTAPTPAPTRRPTPAPTVRPTATPRPTPSPTPFSVRSATDRQLARMGVNEIGRVLVMEYHDVDVTDGRWDISRATFRSQLEELYRRGYRPVTTTEFAAGTFPIPAGTSPVLLTFDDSFRSHLWFGEDGRPHPDSVVGILEEFSRTHPDWRATGAFYVFWPVPFREKALVQEKLQWLAANGYEIGNHAWNHDDLRGMSGPQVQENLSKLQAWISEQVPGYRMRSIALPFGNWPEDAAAVVSGSHDGASYLHDLVLLVGFMPTRSPHHAEYDPTQIMRVQAYPEEFEKWIDWLEEPNRRFVSDGDPHLITYPGSMAEVADTGLRAVRVYGS